jgi:hypothetical protein
MHPYSEYLQEYIYENNKLQQGGKFNNDFCVTTLGRIMRKTWIDELFESLRCGFAGTEEKGKARVDTSLLCRSAGNF